MEEIKGISKLIPFGRENAVSRQYLISKCFNEGLIEAGCKDPDRKMRRLIADEKAVTPILYASYGYYRPTEADEKNLREYVNSETGRAMAILKGLNSSKALLSDLEHHRNELENWVGIDERI